MKISRLLIEHLLSQNLLRNYQVRSRAALMRSLGRLGLRYESMSKVQIRRISARICLEPVQTGLGIDQETPSQLHLLN